MSLRSRASLGERKREVTLRFQKLPLLAPLPSPGPTYFSVCLLWGVEVLLAALARMASGEREGLHGVDETSRVARGGEHNGWAP